jgi:hypothetical protein
MHAKYEVAIFNIAKVIAKCKSWRKPTSRPTNQPTDQQTGQKQYVPHYYSGGHKKAQYCSTAIIKIAELLLICGVD